MNPLSAAEIGEIIKSKISNVDLAAETRNEGVVLSVNDGIVRIYGLSAAKQGEMLEFPGNTYGLALNLESDFGRRGYLGALRAFVGRRFGQMHRARFGSPGRRGAVGAHRQFARRADRRRRRNRVPTLGAARKNRPRRHLAAVGFAAAANRTQSHRHDGADRSRPARIDYRRSANRQNRHRHRCDYQSERQKLRLRLCRHRAKSVLGRRRRAQIGGARRARAHDCRFGDGFGFRGVAIYRALRRLHDGRILPRSRPRRAHRLRRFDEASVGVSPNLAFAAPPAGARGLSGRCFLFAFAAVGARGAGQSRICRARNQRRNQRQNRLFDGVADYRNASGGCDRRSCRRMSSRSPTARFFWRPIFSTPECARR